MSSNLSSNYLQFKFGMANGNGHKIYEFDEFRLDAAKMMLYRDGQEILLPPKVVKTLAVLVEDSGEILSKNELLERVWEGSIVEESNLSQYLYLLRKTLGEKPDGKPYIETLRRRGYRFTGKCSQPNDTDAAKPVDVAALKRVDVERTGNVVALADWKDAEANQAVSVPAVEPERRTGRRTKLVLAVAAAIIILVLSTAFAVHWLGAGANDTSDKNGELSVVRLTNGLNPRGATISPDGKYFVYHELEGDRYRMWLQQTGQSSRVEVIPVSDRVISDKTFSPDGQFIYFLTADRSGARLSLSRVPTLGGPVANILSDINSPVSFSPDGREIVFARWNKEKSETSFVIKASDGSGVERQIYALKAITPWGGYPIWSPDGRQITFSIQSAGDGQNATCSLASVPAGGGELVPLSDEKWDECFRMAWKPDGSGIYMIGTKEGDGLSIRRSQVYFISYPQGRSRKITTEDSRHQPDSLGVTTDGSVIAVPFNRSSQIWSMNANGDSRTAVQISNGLADGRPGIAPLPDGRVAYITRTGESLNVWVMNQDGSDQKQLTVDPEFIEEVRSGGDGRYLVFSGVREREQHLFRINSDGTHLRQLTFGESAESDSSLSNDGNWVVFGSTDHSTPRFELALFKVPVEGGERIRLNQKDCNMPHFSPDDKYISCVKDQKEMLILSAEDGTLVRSLAALPNSSLGFGARWTPDGKALVYIVSPDWKGSNLWVQPIDGGQPKPLTDFTNGSIYHFAYSRDGERLFLARGNQIHDAVLITSTK